jgi:hypothetical protein
VEQHRRRLTCSRCLQFKSSASSMTFASRRSPIRHTTQKHTVSDRPQRCPRLHSVSSVVPNSKARCWTLRQQLCRFALADWERGAVPCPRVRVRDQCQSARLVFTSPPPKPSARSRGRSCPTLLCVPIHRQLGKSFSQSEPCPFTPPSFADGWVVGRLPPKPTPSPTPFCVSLQPSHILLPSFRACR